MFMDLDNRPAAVGRSGAEHAEAIRRLLAETVAPVLFVDPAALFRSGRGDARTAFARHVAIYLASTRFGLSLTEAGRLFGRDRTTAAYACRRIEEERDTVGTDRLVDYLDHVIALRLVPQAEAARLA